jgi:hypothetical protein
MNYVKNDEKRGKSYALRLIIHYLGDVHQPLHCLSRVDDNFPAGDRGGNDFPLPTHYTAKELHAVWDSVLYEFHVNDKLVRKIIYKFNSLMMTLVGISSVNQLLSFVADLQLILKSMLTTMCMNGPRKLLKRVLKMHTMVNQ